jgi:putative tricarboxylic transport membrane protein
MLPLAAGSILAILSLALYIKSRTQKENQAMDPWFPQNHWKTLALVIGILLMYAVLLEVIGFLSCTFFLFLVLLRIMQPRKLIWVILISALAAGLSYVIFDILLKVQLPRGLWDI